MSQGHYPAPYPAPPTQHPQYQQYPQYPQYPQQYAQHPAIGYGTGRFGAYPPAEPDEMPRHSGLGIVSVVLAVLAGVVLLGTCVGALGRVRHDPNFLLDDKDPAAMGFRLFFTVGACLNLVGLALGFGGMTDPTRKKVFAALGLAFNATITLAVLGLMLLGSMSR